MFLKLFADNYNPYKGNNIVQLRDAAGDLFPAQILPIEDIDLSLLPRDRVSYELLFVKENSRALSAKAHRDHFFRLVNYFCSYYVIGNIPESGERLPTMIYGYAGFSKKWTNGCLDLYAIYSAHHYEKTEKYNVKLFGTNMIAFGAYLSGELYGTEGNRALHVPRIEKNARKFYDKLNFVTSPIFIFGRKGFLTRSATNIMFDR